MQALANSKPLRNLNFAHNAIAAGYFVNQFLGDPNAIKIVSLGGLGLDMVNDDGGCGGLVCLGILLFLEAGVGLVLVFGLWFWIYLVLLLSSARSQNRSFNTLRSCGELRGPVAASHVLASVVRGRFFIARSSHPMITLLACGECASHIHLGRRAVILARAWASVVWFVLVLFMVWFVVLGFWGRLPAPGLV